MSNEIGSPGNDSNATLGWSQARQWLDRRGFFGDIAAGIIGVALMDLERKATGAEAKPSTEWQPGRPQFAPKARQVLHIFCPGAASHIDLWDYKPSLSQYHGTPLPGEEALVSFQGKNGNLMKSPWPFVQAGQTGKPISTMLPHMARHVDDIAFMHGMVSRTNTHGPGCIFMNTGFVREGFPSAGAWVGYALGSLNDNLPRFVAMPDVRGEPPNGKANWSAGFLPAAFQAVPMSAQQAIRNLNPPKEIPESAEIAARAYLDKVNRRYAEAHVDNSELAARVASYELAARMQLAAPEAAGIDREPNHIKSMYGVDDSNPLKAAYARNCLMARRFLERGVRYVSLYCASRASGVDGLLNWDAHKTLKADYERHCPIFDQPTAALIEDLKARGLLDKDVLILWTTEFGRMPTHQEGTTGRDHNPDAFTCWMMGAGVKGGTSFGMTDEFGRKSIENVTTIYDFYATVLHLLGIDHERLTYYHNGTNRRLTDVHGHVVKEILA
jgi:uncharacterized protein (DUF1501 family)